MTDIPSISAISEEELLELVPTGRIEEILGDQVSWRVMRTKEEILDWHVDKYNHCVVTDIHERNIDVPKAEHPLHRYFSTHIERPDFADVVGYEHNQFAIEGVIDEETCLNLHIAAIYPSSLHLGYLELANPTVRNSNPMDAQQRYAGIGHGVLVEIIDNLQSFARKLGLTRITGYAVDMLRARIFCRKGFQLDPNGYMYETAVEYDQQIPIIIELD